MSETVTEPTVETSAAPEEAVTADPAAEVEKWKAMARKHETRAKENADKARRLDEIEESSKSELEKLQARLAAAEKQASEASLKALRADVAQAKGVPASLLTGGTEDELNASADALLAFRGKPPVGAPAEGIQGNTGKPIGTTDWDQQIAAARQSGNVALSIYLQNQRAAEVRH